MARPKVLLDGDIIAYRSAFSANDGGPEDAENKADELIGFILEQTLDFPTKDDYDVFLTGRGNFRHDVAKSYKANRKDSVKPVHLYHVREYLVDKYDARVSNGEEADDLIAIEATRIGPDAIVASVDKDFLQLPCRHYNFSKNTFETVSEEDGLKFFYKQILTGDRADNVAGLYRYGPVKAEATLKGCKTEQELYDAVVKAYNGDVDKVIETARLLWLRRYEDQLWEPPVSGEAS